MRWGAMTVSGRSDKQSRVNVVLDSRSHSFQDRRPSEACVRDYSVASLVTVTANLPAQHIQSRVQQRLCRSDHSLTLCRSQSVTSESVKFLTTSHSVYCASFRVLKLSAP